MCSLPVFNKIIAMKYCCPGFECAVDNAGKRGPAVFVEDIGSKPLFLMQWRFADKEVADSIVINSPHAVSLIEDVGLRYCPWCGVSLKDFYSKSWQDLVRPDLRLPKG
jgi:hypothetical protein